MSSLQFRDKQRGLYLVIGVNPKGLCEVFKDSMLFSYHLSSNIYLKTRNGTIFNQLLLGSCSHFNLFL